MHALPGRHREGGGSDGEGAVGRGAAQGPVAGDGRRIDLRPGPGRAESDRVRVQIFSARAAEHRSRNRMNAPLTQALEQERVVFKLNGEEVNAFGHETIIETADRVGVAIPRLCYKP